jgi:predicted membrane protein
MKDFENNNEERGRRWERREARRKWVSEWEERMEQHRQHRGHGHVWTGIFLLIIGGLALVKSLGVPMPDWLLSWQMLLIAIGLFIGLRKGFRGGWFVPVIIGTAFLLNDFFLIGELREHMWPLILIILGLVFVFRPRRRTWEGKCFQKKNTTNMQAETIIPETGTPLSEESYNHDDFIDTTSIFGGTQKVILSKNFKGGDMVNIFGGSEIDLTKADINGTATLEVTAIFGGATLIVPSNWVVKSEAVTIFGGISDKRKNVIPFSENATKALILKGTVLFGGIEIKSF